MTADRAAVMARLHSLYGKWSDDQALQFSESSARHWFTWGDLGEVHSALVGLVAGHQLSESAAFVIVMRQRPAMVAAELAALAEGRTALLVTPLQSDRSLVADIELLQPAVVVAHAIDWERAGVAAAVAGSAMLGIEVDDRDGRVQVRLRCSGAPRPGPLLDAAVTVLSSGTTGPAKRLPVEWATFVQLGGGPEGREPRSGKGALILSLPLVTLGGLLSMARLVFAGRPMSMTERFDVREWASLVKEHRPTVIGAPPPVVQMILDADISPDHFEGVTAYLTSSAAVRPEVARAFEGRYGFPVLLGYGATEFLNSVTGWSGALWERFGTTKLGSTGRALPGVRLRVVDPVTGQELPTDVVGLLEVDPPQRAGGLPDGWLRTADRARVDEDGFLWILGRTDDVIVRGGFKIDLATIESALREHPAVTDACAVGLVDDRLGAVPVAIVTVNDRVEPSDLLLWLRDRLPPYSVPTVVRIVDEIPLTTTFKPHRAEVRRTLEGDHP
ncbi:MAG: hypothetical protein RLZZ623_146 [Actinomycetota bacterium]